MSEGQFVAERWSSGWPGKPRRDTIVWEDQGDGDFLLTVWNEFGDRDPDMCFGPIDAEGVLRVLDSESYFGDEVEAFRARLAGLGQP